MSRLLKVVMLLLSLLFLSVFAWKNTEEGSEDGSSRGIATKDLSDQQQFWHYMNEGDQQRLQGNYHKAEDSYSSALEINPNHSGALYYLGNVQLFMRDYGNAEKNWRKIVREDSIVARAWLQLGKVYFCNDPGNPFYDPNEAERYFEKAAALNRENTGPPLHLAKIEILKRDYSAAAEFLDGITAQNFKSYEGMFLKGFVNWEMGSGKSAQDDLNEAIEIFSSSNQIKMDGEGATESGSNPMLSEEKFCDFFGKEIQRLLIHKAKNPTVEIFREFDLKVDDWRSME